MEDLNKWWKSLNILECRCGRGASLFFTRGWKLIRNIGLFGFFSPQDKSRSAEWSFKKYIKTVFFSSFYFLMKYIDQNATWVATEQINCAWWFHTIIRFYAKLFYSYIQNCFHRWFIEWISLGLLGSGFSGSHNFNSLEFLITTSMLDFRLSKTFFIRRIQESMIIWKEWTSDHFKLG